MRWNWASFIAPSDRYGASLTVPAQPGTGEPDRPIRHAPGSIPAGPRQRRPAPEPVPRRAPGRERAPGAAASPTILMRAAGSSAAFRNSASRTTASGVSIADLGRNGIDPSAASRSRLVATSIATRPSVISIAPPAAGLATGCGVGRSAKAMVGGSVLVALPSAVGLAGAGSSACAAGGRRGRRPAPRPLAASGGFGAASARRVTAGAGRAGLAGAGIGGADWRDGVVVCAGVPAWPASTISAGAAAGLAGPGAARVSRPG